jgi:hypothetical protein
MLQVALKLLALLLKLKAEVKAPPGAVMHVLAAFVVTQSVCEIAGPRAAVAALNPAVLLLKAGLLLMAAMAMSTAMLVYAAMA